MKHSSLLVALLCILLLSTAGVAQKDPGLVDIAGTPTGGTFTLPGTTCSSAGGTNCSIALPDNDPAGVMSSFTFAGCTDIVDVNVGLDIASTWVGDLIVSVDGPSASSAILLDRPGAPALGGAGCSDDNVQAVMDDEGTEPAEDACMSAGANPGLSGSLIPTDMLSVFDGQSADGVWSLTASDNAAFDANSLNDWSIEVTCNAPSVVEVPTMGTWGIGILLGLLSLVGLFVLRRQN